eukprot:357719-Chlamydomonas_euryale.AAC.3
MCVMLVSPWARRDAVGDDSLHSVTSHHVAVRGASPFLWHPPCPPTSAAGFVLQFLQACFEQFSIMVFLRCATLTKLNLPSRSSTFLHEGQSSRGVMTFHEGQLS